MLIDLNKAIKIVLAVGKTTMVYIRNISNLVATLSDEGVYLGNAKLKQV